MDKINVSIIVQNMHAKLHVIFMIIQQKRTLSEY